MSMPRFVFGREVDAFDPFSLDVSHPDPFVGFPLSSYSTSASYPSPLIAGRSASFPFPAAGRDLSPFARAATRVDWKETPAAHVFKADVPGLGKDEVKVEVEDGRVLQISGERTRERQEKTDTWHCVERGSGMFLKRFHLPENAEMEKVTAAMENGVLTVTVPKKKEEAGKVNVRSIEISG